MRSELRCQPCSIWKAVLAPAASLASALHHSHVYLSTLFIFEGGIYFTCFVWPRVKQHPPRLSIQTVKQLCAVSMKTAQQQEKHHQEIIQNHSETATGADLIGCDVGSVKHVWWSILHCFKFGILWRVSSMHIHIDTKTSFIAQEVGIPRLWPQLTPQIYQPCYRIGAHWAIFGKWAKDGAYFPLLSPPFPFPFLPPLFLFLSFPFIFFPSLPIQGIQVSWNVAWIGSNELWAR